MAKPVPGPDGIDQRFREIVEEFELLNRREEKLIQEIYDLGREYGRDEFMLFRNCSKEILQLFSYTLDKKRSRVRHLLSLALDFLAEKCSQSPTFREHVEQNGLVPDGSRYGEIIPIAFKYHSKESITAAVRRHQRKVRKEEEKKRSAKYDRPKMESLAQQMSKGIVDCQEP